MNLVSVGPGCSFTSDLLHAVHAGADFVEV